MYGSNFSDAAKIFLLTTLLISFAANTTAQEELLIPDFFIQITGDSDLQQKIAEAQSRAKSQFKENRFWVGYRFQLREDVRTDFIYISDDGGITISRGDEAILHEGRLQTHSMRSREWSRERTEEKQGGEVIHYGPAQLGLFYLLDAGNLEVKKIKLFYLTYPDLKRKFEEYPGFWFGQADNRDSFDNLAQTIDSKNYRKNIVDPAIFVLSLHEHPAVIPYLADLAGGERYFDIRKSAAFWLGQIPKEESFDALVKLFAKEKDREMKEKLVFSIGQHKSDKSIGQLAKIAGSDEDFEIREKAIFWIGQNDREASLELLQKILKEAPATELKEKVVFSISQHRSEKAVPILIDIAKNEPNREVREKAIFWLGQMAGKKTLQVLGDIVETGEETEIKTKAVFAISQHEDKEQAADMLMDIARNHPNAEVRKKAMFWLGQMGDERAVDFFKEILTK